MKLYIGRLVAISKRYSRNHRRLGTLVEKDTNAFGEPKWRAQFTVMRTHADTGEKEYIHDYEWFYENHLKYPEFHTGLQLNEIEEAMYAGIIANVRNELAKTRGRNRVFRFGSKMQRYIDDHARGIYRTKDCEFVCDWQIYKDIDYKLEVI